MYINLFNECVLFALKSLQMKYWAPFSTHKNYAYLTFCNVIAKLLKLQADHLVSGELEIKRYYMVLGRRDFQSN